MVIALLITGSPVGPKVMLLTVVRVWVLPTGSLIVSAPLPAGQPPWAVLVLAARIALTSEQVALTGIIAACPGVAPSANSRATPAKDCLHLRCSARRARRGKARSWV